MKKDNGATKTFVEFLKFGFVGASNVLIYTLLYWILLYFHINYLIATTLAYLISSVWGYCLNNIWVFKSKKSKKESIVKYYIVYGSSYLLNLLCMFIWVNVLSLSETLAPLITLCVTTPYNFVFNKLWVFKQKHEMPTSDNMR